VLTCAIVTVNSKSLLQNKLDLLNLSLCADWCCNNQLNTLLLSKNPSRTVLAACKTFLVLAAYTTFLLHCF
jgi:hypothetical protein